jgi:hypothetical protein
MIDAGVIVRFACMTCRTIFDVDLVAVAVVRGRGFSLIGANAKCKISRCRGDGSFIASIRSDHTFLLLKDRPEVHMPKWLIGLRPVDIDPPPDPHPPGQDDIWAWRRRHGREKKLAEG